MILLQFKHFIFEKLSVVCFGTSGHLASDVAVMSSVNKSNTGAISQLKSGIFNFSGERLRISRWYIYQIKGLFLLIIMVPAVLRLDLCGLRKLRSNFADIDLGQCPLMWHKWLQNSKTTVNFDFIFEYYLAHYVPHLVLKFGWDRPSSFWDLRQNVWWQPMADGRHASRHLRFGHKKLHKSKTTGNSDLILEYDLAHYVPQLVWKFGWNQSSSFGDMNFYVFCWLGKLVLADVRERGHPSSFGLGINLKAIATAVL